MPGAGNKVQFLLTEEQAQDLLLGDDVVEPPARQAKCLPLVANAACVLQQLTNGDWMSVIREFGQIFMEVIFQRKLPSSSSSTTAMAVNCLETDATW